MLVANKTYCACAARLLNSAVDHGGLLAVHANADVAHISCPTRLTITAPTDARALASTHQWRHVAKPSARLWSYPETSSTMSKVWHSLSRTQEHVLGASGVKGSAPKPLLHWHSPQTHCSVSSNTGIPFPAPSSHRDKTLLNSRNWSHSMHCYIHTDCSDRSRVPCLKVSWAATLQTSVAVVKLVAK